MFCIGAPATLAARPRTLVIRAAKHVQPKATKHHTKSRPKKVRFGWGRSISVPPLSKSALPKTHPIAHLQHHARRSEQRGLSTGCATAAFPFPIQDAARENSSTFAKGSTPSIYEHSLFSAFYLTSFPPPPQSRNVCRARRVAGEAFRPKPRQGCVPRNQGRGHPAPDDHGAAVSVHPVHGPCSRDGNLGSFAARAVDRLLAMAKGREGGGIRW